MGATAPGLASRGCLGALALPRRQSASNAAEVVAALRVVGGAGEALAPLMQGPDPKAAAGASGDARREGWGLWVSGQLQVAHAPASAAAAAAGVDAGATRRSWMLSTILLVSCPPSMPSTLVMPYMSWRPQTSSRMTVLRPGRARCYHLARLEIDAPPRAGALEVRPLRAALVHHDLLRHHVVRVHEVLPAGSEQQHN